jgi:hypothetical protein
MASKTAAAKKAAGEETRGSVFKSLDFVGKMDTAEHWNGEITILEPPYHFRSGLACLDLAIDKLGRGFGATKMAEVYGVNKSGKSELSQLVLDRFLYQLRERFSLAMCYDKERALMEELLVSKPHILGARDSANPRMVIARPHSLESLIASLLKLMLKLYKEKTPEPLFILIDSLASFDPKKRVEDTTKLGQKSQYSEIPAILSQTINEVRTMLDKTNAFLMWINEARENLESPGDIKSPGGHAFHHRQDYRIHLQYAQRYWMQNGKTSPTVSSDKPKPPSNGHVVRASIVKNRLFMPERRLELVLTYQSHGKYASGLSDLWTTWEALRSIKLIDGANGVYTFYTFEEGQRRQIPGAPKFTRKEWPDVFMEQFPDKNQYAAMNPKSPCWLALLDWQRTCITGDISAWGNTEGDEESGEGQDGESDEVEDTVARTIADLQAAEQSQPAAGGAFGYAGPDLDALQDELSQISGGR